MKKSFKIIIKLSILLIIIGVVFAGVLITDSVRINLNEKKLEGNIYDINFFDKDNNEIIETDILYSKKPEQRLSEHTYNAFIAIEDKRFYDHNGIDLKRILKAAWNNVKSLSFKEGASTISQQLIKNTQLTPNKNLFRKTREIKLAFDLEKKYSKQEIIDMYLNIIYFGSGCYGIENASCYYFDKSANDLTINESAALAAIIKAPNYYSPFSNYDKMLARKDVVLKQMYENNLLSKQDYYANKNKDIVLCKTQNITNEYNDYIKACLNEISDILNVPLKELKSLSYNVYTYMDTLQQKNLHNVIKNQGYYKDFKSTDSVGLIIDNDNFSVSAISVKSMFPFDKIIRQPGSAIKPMLVYAPAIEYNLISPATEILDEKTDFGNYCPSNYNGKNYGYVSTRYSLSNSLNIPAVKVFNSVGIDKAKLFAKRCGINFEQEDNNLSLALGGFYKGINLKELAAGYIPFSNGGYYKNPQFIKMIKDDNGNIIYNDNTNSQKIMRDDTAYLISDMLKDSVKNGTASKLKTFDFPLCSKTGTVGNSNYNTDAYNISYTTNNTFAVWMGSTMEEKLDLKITGGTYPTFMMKDILKNYYKDNKPKDFLRPESIVECDIDTENIKLNHSIKLATDITPEKYIKKEIFSVHFMPQEYSDCFNFPCVDNSEIVLKNNKIIINFDAKEYLQYEIIRLNNDIETVIEIVTNKNGNVKVIDNNIDYGKTYRYYIVPVFENKNQNKIIKGNIFMSNKIVVPYKFSPKDDNYIEDDFDEQNWWDDEDFNDFDID